MSLFVQLTLHVNVLYYYAKLFFQISTSKHNNAKLWSYGEILLWTFVNKQKRNSQRQHDYLLVVLNWTQLGPRTDAVGMGAPMLFFHHVQVGTNVGTGSAQQHISVPQQTTGLSSFSPDKSPKTMLTNE